MKNMLIFIFISTLLFACSSSKNISGNNSKTIIVLNSVMNGSKDVVYSYDNKYNAANSEEDQMLNRMVDKLNKRFKKHKDIRFYTKHQAEVQSIHPNVQIDFFVSDIQVEGPVVTSTTNRNTEVMEVGRDSDRKPIYEYKTIEVDHLIKTYSAMGNVGYRIIDTRTKNPLETKKFISSFKWSTSTSSGRGDALAITPSIMEGMISGGVGPDYLNVLYGLFNRSSFNVMDGISDWAKGRIPAVASIQ